MKLKLTKNNTIILTSVILVLSIALGFLVWRVNQKETTAPTESSAMGEGCSAGVQCTGGEPCYWPWVAYCDYSQPQGSYPGTCTCKTWEWQQQNDPDYACWDSAPRCTPSAPPGNYELCCTYNDCDDPACQNDSPNTVEVVCSAKCESCSNPYVYQTRYKLIEEEPYCGDSNLDSGEECDPPGGSCTKDGKPGVCSSTCTCNLNPYCGDSNLDTGEECDPPGGSCTKNGKPGVCSSTCTCDLNPYCGDSNLDTGEECDPPGGSCTKNGKPGVCSSTCTCDLNPYCGDGNLDSGEECDPPGGTCTKDGNPGVCNSSCTCVANPYCGDSKLNEGEECEQGDPTGVECSWSTCNQTACICLPAGLNISKSVVESCIDEGTENPSSQLVYTISVTNTGQGIGSVRQLEDVLDPKVLSSGITPIEITGGGVYSSGKILWSFIPSLDISPGTTEIFSYKVLISKENFGIYNNTVTLTPESGDTIQANATIEADCLVTVPQTGIFDSTLGRISVGFILLLIGGVVYNLPSEIFINKFNKNRFKYRVKFENNIWKKN